jgi:alkylation response protein AidB-like acyl-CoA dehydrogenase
MSGVVALAVPEEYGGIPIPTVCCGIVTEELACGRMSLACAMGCHTLVAGPLLRYGAEEQNRAPPPATMPTDTSSTAPK